MQCMFSLEVQKMTSVKKTFTYLQGRSTVYCAGLAAVLITVHGAGLECPIRQPLPLLIRLLHRHQQDGELWQQANAMVPGPPGNGRDESTLIPCTSWLGESAKVANVSACQHWFPWSKGAFT